MSKSAAELPPHGIRGTYAYICILFPVLLMLFCISSCGIRPKAEASSRPDETEAVISAPTEWKQYVLVRADDCSVYVSKIALALQSAIAKEAGAELPIITDSPKLYPIQEYEIILGQTSRDGSVYDRPPEEPKAGEYALEAVGSRIAVRFTDLWGGIRAGESLLRQLVSEEVRESAVEVYYDTLESTKVFGTLISLRSVYASGMLLQQDAPIRITGTAEPGTYTVMLSDDSGVIRETSVTVEEDGVFSAALKGVHGSYTAYSLRVTAHNVTVAEYTDILFGELWLATGQSNMHYRLTQDIDYPASYTPDAYIRVMQVECPSCGYPEQPIGDSDRITWLRGDNPSSANRISAVGYYFCTALRERLDVPVGLIQYAVGGAPIRSWMSPETAAALRADPRFSAKYTPTSAWKTDEYRQAGAVYNAMASPAAGLCVAGMLWYQGEQDLNEKNGYYTAELDALYRQYCAMYGFKDHEMPLILPIIVPYLVTSHPQFYAEMTTAISEYAQSLPYAAALPVNDVSPAHAENNVASHPMTKRPVGLRLAASALAMVYHTAAYEADPPHAVSLRAEGNRMLVTFEHTADGLIVADGSSVLRGFTICGENGVFYPADAEIISPDCVAVFSPNVPEPVCVAYAYELLTVACNLGCRLGSDGTLLYMAAPCCIGSAPALPRHTTQLSWADCDLTHIWHLTNRGGHLGKYYPSWTAAGAVALCHDTAVTAQGDAALKLHLNAPGDFSVGPTTIGTDALGQPIVFPDVDTNYRKYKSLTIQIKNDTAAQIRLTGLSFGAVGVRPLPLSETIPSDGEWKKVTISLREVEAASLANVQIIAFHFMAESAGDVYLDDVRFYN